MISAQGSAPARAALAGNPSDGYGGAVLAVTLPRSRAQAVATRERSRAITPENALVRATVERFTQEFAPAAADCDVRWMTSIPQRVGLGSSSALVIAVTRAMCELYGIELDPADMARFALRVETEGLGIAAGLQDRVAQTHEGLTFMDFSDPPRYERLDLALLPPLVIAWRESTASDSGAVHGQLQARGNDPEVRAAMIDLATAARTARDALVEGDHTRFRARVDETFDLRRRLMPLDPRCVEMIEAARAAGASANYTGSGGAIVAACRDEAHSDAVSRALAAIGFEVSAV